MKILFACAVAALLVAVSITPIHANDDVYWDDQFGIPGANYGARATAFDSAGRMYLGGTFTAVGNVRAHCVAMWDGATWSPLGQGTRGHVFAVAVLGDSVYAGGSFSEAGGTTASMIARWDGTAWHPLGTGVDRRVRAMAAMGGNLYVGGDFTVAGGVPVPGIARWNGTAWSALDGGASNSLIPEYPERLAVVGNSLYVSGNYDGIVKWDGSTWSVVDTGTKVLGAGGTDLYAGGYFAGEGEQTAWRVRKWDGTQWSFLGTGMNGWVACASVMGTAVYAGGTFTAAGGNPANGIAKWDGGDWSAVGVCGSGGASSGSSVAALAVNAGMLYAGGDFSALDGCSRTYNVARWDGAAWAPLGTGLGMCGRTNALAVYGNGICAANCAVPWSPAISSSVAKLDTAGWTVLAPRVDHEVLALAAAPDGLYAGGKFRHVGGVALNGVARWDGTLWSAVGTGVAGTDDQVNTLASDGANVYAGGRFGTMGGVSAGCIAMWNGTLWSALGGGTDYAVRASAILGGNLYIGGDFYRAGSTWVNNVAMWNGASWVALGAGISGGVNAVATDGTSVYAGGSRAVGKWDGTNWRIMAGDPCGVMALVADADGVYAGGQFLAIDGVAAGRVARWDGATWNPLGSGVDGEVRAMTMIGRALFVGGEFSVAGGKVSGAIACCQPRVNVTSANLAATPGEMTIGDDPYGFYKPLLVTNAGTRVSYSGGLPVAVTLDQAPEVEYDGKRVNGAFRVMPAGVRFGGAGATIRVEFSEDDVAAYPGATAADFRAVAITYPADYPVTKEALKVQTISPQVPVPVRIENGRQIYAVTANVSATGPVWGAVPGSWARQLADISVTKTASPDPAIAEQPLRYTVSVTNNGPAEATLVRAVDVLPGSVTLLDAAVAPGTETEYGGRVYADFGTLASGQTGLLTLDVIPQSETQYGIPPLANTWMIRNDATALAEQGDPAMGNNSASLATAVYRTSATADLAVSITEPGDPVTTGAAFECVMTATNLGPAEATGVVLRYSLPQWTALDAAVASQGTVQTANGEVAALLGSIPAGGNATLTVRLNLTAESILVHRAAVRGDQIDPFPANNSAVEYTTVDNGPSASADLAGRWLSLSASTRTTRAGMVWMLRGQLAVTNDGMAAAAPTRVRYYLSADPVVDAGDRLLLERGVGRMPALRTLTQPVSLRLPADVTPAGMYVLAVLDATGVLPPGGQGNNLVPYGPIVLSSE